MEIVLIEFMQWEKYNKRKDIKHPVWFAMSNRVLEDDAIHALTDSEFRAFVYLLCLASQQNNDGAAEVNLEKAERISGIKKSVIQKTLEKLTSFGICTRHERDPFATRQDKTLQEYSSESKISENQNLETAEKEPDISPRVLVEIWNSDRGPLSAVEKLTDQRKASASSQLAKYPDLKHWRQVLAKWKASSFCVNQWKPTFDDWLKESKRIATLEGRYDNRAAQSRYNPRPEPKPIRYKSAEDVFKEQESMRDIPGEQVNVESLPERFKSILSRVTKPIPESEGA